MGPRGAVRRAGTALGPAGWSVGRAGWFTVWRLFRAGLGLRRFDPFHHLLRGRCRLNHCQIVAASFSFERKVWV